MREMDRRIEVMENVQEDVDLDHLEGKESFSVHDVIKVIKNMQAEIMSKTVMQADLDSMREQIVHMERNNETFLEKQRKDMEFLRDKDAIQKLPSVVKEVQMHLLRVDNHLMEEGAKRQEVENRVKSIETANTKSDQIMQLIANNGGQMDSKALLEQVMSITNEV